MLTRSRVVNWRPGTYAIVRMGRDISTCCRPEFRPFHDAQRVSPSHAGIGPRYLSSRTRIHKRRRQIMQRVPTGAGSHRRTAGWAKRAVIASASIATVVIAAGVIRGTSTSGQPNATATLAPYAGLDPSQLPADKRAALERSDQARTGGAATQTGSVRPPDVPNVITPTRGQSASVAGQPAGAGHIISSGEVPPTQKQSLRVANRWVEASANPDASIAVFAGALKQDPSQGVLYVWPGPASSSPGGFYVTPSKSGSIHITNADGHRLTVLAEDGTTFIFDTNSRTFQSP